jgi:hypothetical protein
MWSSNTIKTAIFERGASAMKTPARICGAVLSLAFAVLILIKIPHTTSSFAQVSSDATAPPVPGTSGGPFVAETIFTAPSPVVALAVGGDGLLYVLTYDGDILKVSLDGTSTSIATGISSCSFSSYALVALPDGSVIANSCADTNDILIKIDPAGNQSTLVQLESHVLSMASDPSGNLYVGTWSSEGDLTLMFDPSTYLAGAVNISGQISLVDSTGVLTTVYESGPPLALDVSDNGDLYVAVWGKSGGFSAENKSYSVCDLRNFFWVTLSEQVEVQRISNGQTFLVTDQLDAVGSLMSKNGLLLAYGFPPEQACGIFRIEQGQPQRLSFTEEGVDKSITGMGISGDMLYFSNVDGNVYRVSLEGLSVAAEEELATPSAPLPETTELHVQLEDPEGDVPESYLDVIELTVSLDGEMLEATLRFRDLPEDLTFDRDEMPEGPYEYSWKVQVFMDEADDQADYVINAMIMPMMMLPRLPVGSTNRSPSWFRKIRVTTVGMSLISLPPLRWTTTPIP